ncbi:major allergen I polypeptide chain 1-like [Balaenoptera ricei]|uniref:major allergen I polypeptide chain 1-like n=1 Tax=Balaenoptera ricei TaxID=2746895 RepID=UPI0028BDCCD4|nr:major allergen I polypeptide chain 1-like [Balaenoptera ricei]
MMRAGALLMLCTALLPISGGNCDICPALKETLSLFVAGTPEDYMANVRQYETDPLVLDTASQLKSCADRKLTDEG